MPIPCLSVKFKRTRHCNSSLNALNVIIYTINYSISKAENLLFGILTILVDKIEAHLLDSSLHNRRKCPSMCLEYFSSDCQCSMAFNGSKLQIARQSILHQVISSFSHEKETKGYIHIINAAKAMHEVQHERTWNYVCLIEIFACPVHF